MSQTPLDQLSIDETILAEARALGLNPVRAAEAGLRTAITQAKAERWREENAAAIESSNQWVAQNGLLLERFRQF